MTSMDDVFSIDGDFSRKKLLENLDYLMKLAERTMQPPPKLDNDPEIPIRYKGLSDFIKEHGKD